MVPSEKRILFLDDDRLRIAQFVAWVETLSMTATTVETAEECIAHLQAGEWDLVLLDHDLGGETFVDSSRRDTGMEVVRWLRLEVSRGHGAFVVHSMNAVAATAMYFDLQEIGFKVAQAPFGSAEFYKAATQFLGVSRPRMPRKKVTISDRIRSYLRSIKSGK